MEIEIGFLALVLVLMQAELVVMRGLVLPLASWLDAEQLHEVLDFDVAVAAAQGLTRAEEPIFHGS